MYYVLLNDSYDEKGSILYPEVVGPFDTEDEAMKLIEQHPRFFKNAHGWGIRPVDGGYAAAHIVGPDTGETSPKVKLTEWREYANAEADDAPAHARP